MTPLRPRLVPPDSPLRLVAFRRLWVGGLINDLGDWTLLIALPVVVFELTGSALVTSTVFVVELVAGLVAGQLAGVLVDRWDRRRILVVSGVIQAAALVPLLAVNRPDRIWLVYIVAAVESCFARLCGPAKAALVPDLVPYERLAAANGMSAVADNLARLVGSPLGGLAVEIVGLPGVVVIDAATYLASSLLIAGIPGGSRPGVRSTEAATRLPVPSPAPAAGIVAEWLDGLRTIRADRRLATLIGIAALGQLAQGIFVVLFVVFVLDRLGGSGGDVGLIRGVQAVGGVLGGLLVPALGRRLDGRRLIGWGYVAFGAIALTTWNLPAISVALVPYLVLFVATGIPGVATSTGVLTAVQGLTPATHLGRVFASFEAGAAVLAAIGVLGAGALSDRVGVTTILDVQGLIYVLCGVLALALLRGLPARAAAARTVQPAAGPVGPA